MPDERLQVEKPEGLPYRPVRFHLRKLFRAAAKTTTHAVTGQWARLPTDVVEVVESVGVEMGAGQLAWRLIETSLLRAMLQIYGELEYRLLEEHALEELGGAIEEALEDEVDLRLDRSFFDRPDSLPLLQAIETPFGDWLIGAGLEEAPARTAADRLPRYFVFALHTEWRDRKGLYRPVQEEIEGADNPFADAAADRRAWARYREWLRARVEEPVLDQTFGLRQIYVPLRAYRDVKVKKEERGSRRHPDRDREVETIRQIGWLREQVFEWLTEEDRDDAIRLASGGPGSGKSSFVKMLAAELAEREDARTVFVPLHRFDLDEDLENALREFAANHDYLPELPSKLSDAEHRWILIFDGLDELGAVGKKAEQVASRFVQEVRATVSRLNQSRCRVQVLITGRDVAIDNQRQNLRRNTTVLHLLGFGPPEKRLSNMDRTEESKEIRELDQRDAWWALFGRLIGESYSGLPSELRTEKLEDVTNQPLLNHLLALSYRRDKLDWDQNPTLNEVYRDLLAAVFESPHRGKGRGSTAIRESFDEDDFIRTLEEVALATWHGRGRSATIEEITSRCKEAGLEPHLKNLAEQAQSGVTRLLTAFYFREQRGERIGDRAFEFTHKSFGEYLIARRLVRLIVDSSDLLSNQRFGFDEIEVLARWAKICGPTPMDEYIHPFLEAELALYAREECVVWHRNLVRLATWALNHRLPMDKLGLSSFEEESLQCRNGEETLLLCLASCASRVRELSRIEWGNDRFALAKWLMRLELFQFAPLLGRKALAWLAAEGQNLSSSCLRDANLANAQLSRSILENTDLGYANLRGADLRGAGLYGADLREADLRLADLREADLRGARLGGANLHEADLRAADLSGADLRDAKISDAQLAEAITGLRN